MTKETRTHEIRTMRRLSFLRHSGFGIPSSFVIGFPSDLRFPTLPIFPTPQLAGFLVADDSAGLRFEVERAAGAPGDVSQVTPECALDPFLNLRVQLAAVADAVDEVREMTGVVPLAFDRGNLLAVEVINFIAVAGDDEIALVTVKTDSETFAFEPARMATMTLPDGRLAVEFVSGHVNVRRFLVVLVLIAPAGAGHAARVLDAETPARDIQSVNAVVAQFAVAPVPAPMPMVVDEIIDIRPLRRGSLPEGVIKPGRHRQRFAASDGAPRVVVPATRERDPADFSGARLGDGLDHPRPAPALIAHLHEAFVFAGRGDHQLAFARVVAARFLHINVFAGGARQDGGGRMPMVRRGDGQNVHRFVLQDLAKILHPLRFFLLLAADGIRAFVKGAAVHVADIADFDVGQGEITPDVIHAATVGPHDSHDDFFVGAGGAEGRDLADRREPGSDKSGLFEKFTALDGSVHTPEKLNGWPLADKPPVPIGPIPSGGRISERSATVPERPVAAASPSTKRRDESQVTGRADMLRLGLRPQPRSWPPLWITPVPMFVRWRFLTLRRPSPMVRSRVQL